MKTNFLKVSVTEEHIFVKDIGPHSQYKTITNAPEDVLERVKPDEKRLFYFDSEGMLTEIIHSNGAFIGYRHPTIN